ncbi:MAG: hypothetical protein ACP5OZ_03210 [Candidatus Woesearchaeota archaeon]
MKIILDTKNDSKEDIEALISFLNAVVKKEPKKNFEIASEASEQFADFFGKQENTAGENKKTKGNEEEDLDFYEGVQLY